MLDDYRMLIIFALVYIDIILLPVLLVYIFYNPAALIIPFIPALALAWLETKRKSRLQRKRVKYFHNPNALNEYLELLEK